MTLVTWYNQAKQVGDNTQIDTEIDNKIATHTANPQSHDQTGQALQVHKTSDPVTHTGAPSLPTKSAQNASINTIFYASNYGKACYKDYYGQVFQIY